MINRDTEPAGLSSASARLRNRLMALYPRTWRERYGEEFEILLEESVSSPLDVLDIILGALDAHLEFPHESNWRFLKMTNRLRTSLFMVFAAYIGFIVGGLSLYGLIDDSPAIPILRAHGALFAAWTSVQAGAVIGLLAVVAGALPLAIASIHRALTSSRTELRLLLVPFWALLALLLYAAAMAAVAKGWIHIAGIAPTVTPNNFPPGNRLLIGGLMLVLVLGATASMVAVWRVISNPMAANESARALGDRTYPQLYRLAFPPALVATAAMAIMLMATVAFGGLASLALPQWFQSNLGLLLMNTAVSYLITLVIMGLSTVLAAAGVVRGYAAWRAA